MSYIKELRKLVGNMPLELPGTGIIVYERSCLKTTFLLQERSDFNKFGLIGGGIELDETYRQCAARELYEESGLIASEDSFTLQEVYAGPKHVTVRPNGEIVYHTIVVFSLDIHLCTKTDAELDQETKRLQWFDKEGINHLLKNNLVFPSNAPILEDIVEGKFSF